MNVFEEQRGQIALYAAKGSRECATIVILLEQLKCVVRLGLRRLLILSLANSVLADSPTVFVSSRNPATSTTTRFSRRACAASPF